MNRRFMLVVVFLGLAAIGYAVLHYTLLAERTATVLPPEIPADVTDPPIRKVMEAKRKEVIAHPANATAWGELGMAFDAHEQWAPSQECYRRAMELSPTDARWPFLMAEQMNWRVKSSSNKEEAVRLYRIAADLIPPTPAHKWTAALSLADLLTELGRAGEAEPLYRQAFEAEPANPWATFRVAGLLAERGRADEAIRLYSTLARSQYGRKMSAAAIAVLHRQAGKTAEAEKYEHLAEMLPPDDSWPNPYAESVAELRRGRGVLTDTYFVQERAQDTNGVIATATALTEQYPSVESQLLLLRAFVNTGDFPAAVAVADDVLRVAPDAATAHSYLGLARLGLAERAEAEGKKTDVDRLYAQAAEAFGESVRVKPDYAPGFLYRAKALMRLGQLPEAEASARGGIKCRPEEWEGYLVLADVLVAAGRKPEAITAAEQAVKLAPRDEPRAKQALEAMKR